MFEKETKKKCSKKLAGLLPNYVTIQWKLYRDMVGWKAGLAWGKAMSQYKFCIMTERLE